MTTDLKKPMLRALKGSVEKTPPIWLMRQAGRYLPEYRAIRAKQGSFLDLVYAPEMAAEVTLQPIRRFGMDGAILFSDILVIPQALGQAVKFVEGEGPVLDPVRTVEDLKHLGRDRFETILAPINETLKLVRSGLDREGFEQTTLIGFSGAPWTLACYMVEGGASRDFINVKSWAYRDPDGFQILIDLLSDAVIDYCLAQIQAGAEVIQIFDSWSGVLDHQQFAQWVIAPTKKIAAALNKAAPHIPVIGFPRGCGNLALGYAQETKVTALSLDQQTSPSYAAKHYQSLLPVQGNLDPVCLLNGGDGLRRGVDNILAHLGQGPFVFNLGHGIIKETPIAHVEQLVKLVRQ